MIACLRTVAVPACERGRYLDWIRVNGPVRQRHGILLEWILEPAAGDAIVVTAWPSREVFDSWIATPERDRVTASAVHQAVGYQPLTCYERVGGYTNLAALAAWEEAR